MTLPPTTRWLLALVAFLPAGAAAVGNCRARLAADGTVLVTAADASPAVRWGTAPGVATAPFANAASCLAGGNARGCLLGAPGTLAARTAPATCAIHLQDGQGACVAVVRHCSPGLRVVDASFPPGDPRRANAIPLDAVASDFDYTHDAEGIPIPRPKVTFTGVNVQVRSGSGETYVANGLGNLVVGYNEAGDYDVDDPVSRGGSHNVVVGPAHGYESSGGIVAGFGNLVKNRGASVIGGHGNQAEGPWCTIAGGAGGLAVGEASVVGGGSGNRATADFATVSGGESNTASGLSSTVGGGKERAATGPASWAAGSLLEPD
jgi:hypothetical protein